MHIAVLFEYPTLHGGERSMLAVMDALRRQGRGVQFTAIAPDAGPLAEALAARGIVHRRWSVRADRLEGRSSLLSLVADIDPDLIHANSLSMARVLGRVQGHLNRPATGHLRDIIGLSAATIGELNRLDRMIAVSEATRLFHVGQGLDSERTVVIHNGIDLQEFGPRPATGYLHRELKLPREVRWMATIGQIGLRKGWGVLANAAVADPDTHLLLIGARFSDKDETRRYEADLRQRFAGGRWANRVHWLGTRTDVSQMLNEIDLLVHPAQQEPLGRVLLEALASGVPIVATNVGGTREIIDDGTSGILVPPGDAKSLTDAIGRVLEDTELSEQIRRAARATAVERFDVTTSAERHRQFWCGLMPPF